LKQNIADNRLEEGPVRIISRAEPPAYWSQPNRSLNLIVTILIAGVLSVMVASFVEMILLFSRASEGPHN
jgi:capsular polysaccharide biosynthesis protein